MMFIFLVYGLLVFPYCYKCVYIFFNLRSFSQHIMADDGIENKQLFAEGTVNIVDYNPSNIFARARLV